MPVSRFLVFLALLFFVTALHASEADRAAIHAVILRQAHAWETGNEKDFLATLGPDVVFAYPGKRLDREGALKIFRDWNRDFRDTHLRVHQIVIEDNHFSVEYLFTTTNRTTGKTSAAGTVAVGEVREGLIAVWKEYLDGRVSRAQATGDLPADATAEPFPWPDTPESHRP